MQLLQFRSREIDSSSWLPSEAAKYGADPTDQATSSNVKRRQATSSDATGQIRQIRQIRQVRHHSGSLFVVRLWTRRLQRCVEVLDAMQVPAWLRKPFSTSYMSPQKKSITAHLSYFIIMYSLHGVSYTDLSCPYPLRLPGFFRMQWGATEPSSLHLPHLPRTGSHHLHSQIEPATILGLMRRLP